MTQSDAGSAAETSLPPLPSFLIIGAQKSATRWLRHNLGKHPDVFTAEYELAFFNRRRYRTLGTDWYRAQFEGWSDQTIVGEATPGYMMWHHSPNVVARRIHETVPDVRLIAILRNPIDRANSAMVHHMKRNRIRPNAKLLDLVAAQPPEEERFGLIMGGCYAASLRPFQRLFGDQLLVLLHDDVREDPRSAYEHALQHIGAFSDFVPPELDQVVFSNQLGSSARWRHDVTPEERLELYEYFRSDIRRLERMFELDLSRWKPRAAPRGSDASIPEDQDPDESFDRATTWIEGIMANVDHEQLEIEPVESTVRLLLSQAIDGANLWEAVMVPAAADAGAPGRMVVPLGDDPAASYREAAGALRAAMKDKSNHAGMVPSGGLEVPVRQFAQGALVDHVTTAWSLAVLTRQDPTVPSELADVVIPLARRMKRFWPRNGDQTPEPTTLERYLASLEPPPGRSATAPA